jgi:HPt (histidine-containing phosphotransfer) domain-containing protein
MISSKVMQADLNTVYNQDDIFDREEMIARLLGDEEMARRIISRFMEDIPLQLEMLANYLALGQMEAARIQAHTLKGASLNISAHEMGRVSLDIERAAKLNDAAEASRLYLLLPPAYNRLTNYLVHISWIEKGQE